jgi:hypothetical protein
MLLLGSGAFLTTLLPVLTCYRPALLVSRRVESVAASLVLAAYAGQMFGCGISTIASSLDEGLADDHAQGSGEDASHFMGLPINMFSYPTLLYSLAWTLLLALMAGPPTCLAITQPIFLRGDRTSPGAQTPSWLSMQGHRNLFFYGSSLDDGLSSAAVKQSSNSGVASSWTSSLFLQFASAFTLTMLGALVPLVLQSVFLVSWPYLCIVTLVWASMPIPMLALAHWLLRKLGSWLTLRVALSFSALSACFLMPLGSFFQGYSEMWFLALAATLGVVTMVIQSTSMVAASRNFGVQQLDHEKLVQYEYVGPMLSIQTARWLGSAMSYIVLAYALRGPAPAPAYVLNTTFSMVAILETVGFFVLLWEDN